MGSFKFDDVFDRDQDGKFNCKIDPNENGEVSFKLHDYIRKIQLEHKQILEDWCKAWLSKEYELGNDIHPGCFTLIQENKDNGISFGYEYRIEPNEQEMGQRIKWIKCKDRLPDNEEIVICYCQGYDRFGPGTLHKRSNFCIGSHINGCWKGLDNENIDVYAWSKIPQPIEKKHECCNDTKNPIRCFQEYGKLYIGIIEHGKVYEVDYCPYCGKKADSLDK